MYSTIVGVLMTAVAVIVTSSAPVDTVKQETSIIRICGSAGVLPDNIEKPSCP